MKIALRNFLTTLRRYKASSLLNIVGLTLAFTACYIILVQVRWEMTYTPGFGAHLSGRVHRLVHARRLAVVALPAHGRAVHHIGLGR